MAGSGCHNSVHKIRKASTKLSQLKADAVTCKDFTYHFDSSKNIEFHSKSQIDYTIFYGLIIIIFASSANITLEYFRISKFKPKICQTTFIHIKYILIHVLCLLNISILFNMLFTAQNWFPAFINSYLLSVAIPSSSLNDFKSLHSPPVFSHHNFFSFFFFPFIFYCSLSCSRNQAMMSCSDTSFHLHNLDKLLTNLLYWFKEEL